MRRRLVLNHEGVHEFNLAYNDDEALLSYSHCPSWVERIRGKTACAALLNEQDGKITLRIPGRKRIVLDYCDAEYVLLALRPFFRADFNYAREAQL